MFEISAAKVLLLKMTNPFLYGNLSKNHVILCIYQVSRRGLDQYVVILQKARIPASLSCNY